jgi:hypothetical protein
MKSTIGTCVMAIGLLLGSTSLAVAKWLPVHQIASDKPLYVADGATGAWYKPTIGDSSSNWQVSTKQAFSHAVAVTPGGLYEFRMVHATSSDDTTINGLWDIYRDGLLVCNDCVGKAYGLNGAVGDYFKIYVGTPLAYAELWHFSGFITGRFDY